MHKPSLLATIAAIIALKASAVIVPDSIASRFTDRAITPIEGVWQFADDGATLAVYASNAANGDYRIVCLDSPDMRLATGTVLGAARSDLGDGEHYTANLFTDISIDGAPAKKYTFDVTLQNGTIQMKARKSNLKLDFWMLYRFYITMSLHRSDKAPNLTARRVYPAAPSPDTPTIL